MTDERHQIAYDAVADLIHDLEPGSMVTKFVLVAEVIDPDNERGLWCLVAPDAKPWDTLGLCHFAISIEHEDINQEDP